MVMRHHALISVLLLSLASRGLTAPTDAPTPPETTKSGLEIESNSTPSQTVFTTTTQNPTEESSKLPSLENVDTTQFAFPTTESPEPVPFISNSNKPGETDTATLYRYPIMVPGLIKYLPSRLSSQPFEKFREDRNLTEPADNNNDTKLIEYVEVVTLDDAKSDQKQPPTTTTFFETFDNVSTEEVSKSDYEVVNASDLVLKSDVVVGNEFEDDENNRTTNQTSETTFSTTPDSFETTKAEVLSFDNKNITIEDIFITLSPLFVETSNETEISEVNNDEIYENATELLESREDSIEENTTSVVTVTETDSSTIPDDNSTVTFGSSTSETDAFEVTEASIHITDKESIDTILNETLRESSDIDVEETSTIVSEISTEVTETAEPKSVANESSTTESTNTDSEERIVSKSEFQNPNKDAINILDSADTNDDRRITNAIEEETKVVASTTEVEEMTAPENLVTGTEGATSEETTTTMPSTSSVGDLSNSTEPASIELELVEEDQKYLSGNNSDLVAAVQFLHYHDKKSSEQCYKLVNAHWNYATNITEENKLKQLAQTMEYSMFYKEAWRNATSFAWKSFNDTILRRWFKSLSVLGTAALPDQRLHEYNRLKADMKAIYSSAKVCGYSPKEVATPENCNLSLEPDLQRIMTRSRDYDELLHIWKQWRDVSGRPIRGKYLRFVELSNEAAVRNGFRDTSDMWLEAYESTTFLGDLDKLWEQLRPLYEHLHAYVRRRLIRQYGADKIKENGPIPAHLFGNMWAQSWVSLMDIVQPFPGKPSLDVTPIMEAKNMSALEMFKISEEFFTSLGLKAMPQEFWKHSLIEKPKGREILCHASAWDFCNGKDYRIKQCTDITMEDLVTIHHEMGHIQYFLQYARQPNVFREGANPGFHEAIGDVLALSVSTPKHLQSIGLLEHVAEDPEGDLNFLMRAALEKVSFLPSGYLIDLWRWGLFRGEIRPQRMNSKWWELRQKYQGICPPVKRTENDFDPGAKYHVPGNVPYIRYFVSFVIQFQFHKVLCDAAGHTGPLYKCDIYRSKEAGQILSQVMELGSSEHWSEAMKIMTGGATTKMDVQPILEYFQPLMQYFEEQNKNETLGWNSLDPTVCP